MQTLPAIGARIKLLSMPDDPNPIEAGSLGTVTSVANLSFISPDAFQIGVKWDNGRTLSLVEVDSWEVIE